MSGASGASRPPDPDPPWPDRGPDWRHDAPDPPDAFAVPFDIRDGLVLMGWTVLAQVLVQAPLAVSGYGFDSDAANLAIVIASQLFTLAGVLLWLHLRGVLSWRLLGPVRWRWTDLPSGLGVGVSGLIVVVVLVQLIDQLFGPVQQPSQSILETARRGGGLTVALGFVAALVTGPIVEEVVFRGVLFQAFRERLGLWPAMVLSALLWAVVHVELLATPVSLGGLALLGVWLAGAFHRRGSLLVTVIGHAAFNGTVLLVVLIGM